MSALAAKGSEATKKLLLKHGAREPFFGVKVADLKPLQKELRGDQKLAMKLYATGNGDAQYLAGMIADGAKMTPSELQEWAENASWNLISAYTVPWVASENPQGFVCAMKWIESKDELVAVAGWKTLSALATIVPDEKLPLKHFLPLLDRVAKQMPSAPDNVRTAMNGFLIASGTYVAPLGDKPIMTARRIGRIEIDQGETACKVPDAESYILKNRRGAAVAPKRKTVRC